MDLNNPVYMKKYFAQYNGSKPPKKVPNVRPELIESAKKLLGPISDILETEQNNVKRGKKLKLTRLLKIIERS